MASFFSAKNWLGQVNSEAINPCNHLYHHFTEGRLCLSKNCSGHAQAG